MKRKLVELSRREHGPRKRLVALVVESAFFLGVLPVVLAYLSSLIDVWLNLPSPAFGRIGTFAGVLSMVIGAFFAVWAIYAQFTIGRGTPSPVMSTQKLIVQKPYNYCRNPMMLGIILFYLGVALVIGSISAVGLVVLGSAALLVYVKAVEEKELESRFGDSYREYRERTPFILPRLWK